MAETAAGRIAHLRDRIARADHEYYNLGRPELTDSEYDALREELTALEAAHPELAGGDSPTGRVGAPLPRGSSFVTRPHVVPMLSIETITRPEKVREFEQRVATEPQVSGYRVGEVDTTTLTVPVDVTLAGGKREAQTVTLAPDQQTGGMEVCGVS